MANYMYLAKAPRGATYYLCERRSDAEFITRGTIFRYIATTSKLARYPILKNGEWRRVEVTLTEA